MHSASTQQKLNKLNEQLNTIANTRELLNLAMSEAATLNRGEWVLVFGQPEFIPSVRLALARKGIAHFDLTIYEACAHENLYLGEDEILEEFFKPFCKKAPVHEAWFTTGWEAIPMLPFKRQFLLIEEKWTIVDHTPSRRASAQG